MLVGAAGFAFLVLLALLADRFGSRLWYGGARRALFYCRACDLRFPPAELGDQQTRLCPRGHFTGHSPREFPAGTVAIGACVGFIGGVVALLLLGLLPSP